MVGLAALDRLSRGRTLRDWLTWISPAGGLPARLADAAVIATLLLWHVIGATRPMTQRFF